MTQPTAVGPIDEAAALTLRIEQHRAALAELVGRRRQKLDQARVEGTATVAAIARRVRMSQGRVSQVTTIRRGRRVRTAPSIEAQGGVVRAAPNRPVATQEATS